MTVATADSELQTKRDERRTLGVASGAHALHDGYTDLIYVMLPVWQAEFGLSYAAIGALRGLFAGTMASLQIPSGYLAEKLKPASVLAAGTALAGLGYCLAGLSGSFMMLAIALAIGGIGASTQHPIASALVARAFKGPRSLKALGGYNFAGDIGKMTIPAIAALMLTVMPWRSAVGILGAAGFVAAIAIILLTPRPSAAAPAQDAQEQAARCPVSRLGFPTLLSIGVIDSATRMGFLTFLPFILTAKGASLPLIGISLTLVFAGGAVGKLVCAFIGARLGVTATVCLTETLTGILILAILPLRLEAAIAILPLLGIALNGTSSVLYGTIPEFVSPEKRTHAFAIFYTGGSVAGATGPLASGFLGDAVGLPIALSAVACIALTTVPMVWALRPAFRSTPVPSA